MRRMNIAIYFGLLAILLLAAVAGGKLVDESQRQLFDLWAIAVVVIAVLLVGRLRFLQSSGKRQEQSGRIDAAGKGAISTPQSAHTPRIGLTLALTILSLCLAWATLIYLGSMSNGDARSTALANIQLVTSIITAGAALFLSKFAAIVGPSKIWTLRLTAILVLFLEILGLIVLPLMAMRMWTGTTDFSAYASALNLNWLFLTLAAVGFCLFRSRRQDR